MAGVDVQGLLLSLWRNRQMMSLCACFFVYVYVRVCMCCLVRCASLFYTIFVSVFYRQTNRDDILSFFIDISLFLCIYPLI